MSSHPTYLPTKAYFYATGNTPAVDLLDSIPPEDDGRVLILGCGDPRNILHSVYTRGDPGDRRLDVTCCDIEPGVIARNVLLLTLITELDLSSANTLPQIWALFYHLYLDKITLDLVVSQSQKLAEASSDLATWSSSPYASFIKLCSAHTCSELNRCWTKYVEMGTRPASEQLSARARFAKEMKQERQYDEVDTSIRTSGPWFVDMMLVGNKHFRNYWDTGVTSISTSSEKATYVNPTFGFTSVGGERFLVHYGSDPILDFHLAPVLAPIEGGKSVLKDDLKVSDLDTCALDELRGWCASFKRAVRTPRVTVRYFVGDALAFCYALQAKNEGIDRRTAPFIHSLTSQTITLNTDDYGDAGPAPTRFNVLESSNLADHTGLLNLLPAAIPLLEESPSSVLITDTLLPAGESSQRALEHHLCGDVAVMSLLLGVAPTAYSSGFSSVSKVNESLFSSASSATHQSRETFIWRFTSVQDGTATKPVFNASQLAGFLHGVYLKMFSSENVSQLRGIQSNPSAQKFAGLALKHYTRRSFAILLRSIRDRVSTEWDFMLSLLTGRIEDDTSLIIGSNSFQDLYGWLHLTGLYTPGTLELNQTAVSTKDSGGGRFQRWKDIPGMVCVVIVVPRQRLRILTDLDPMEVGTPVLHADVRLPYAHNMFSSIQLCFGTCRAVDNQAEPGVDMVEIDEDPAGLRGTSPMIVSVWMPAWILRQDPANTKVGLSIHPSPFLVRKLMPRLGMHLALFDTKLTDTQHVHIVRDRPGMFGSERTLFSKLPTPVKSFVHDAASNANDVELDFGCERIALLKSRVDIVDPEAKQALASGAEVESAQRSNSTVAVIIQGIEHVINFDVPVDVRSVKLRIARKSSYVEVHVPVAHDDRRLHRFFDPSPVLVKNAPPLLRYIHYLDLDTLPILDTENPERLSLLPVHMAGAFSQRERTMRDTVPQEQRDTICNVKDSIASILLIAAGVQQVKSKVFALDMPPDIGIYTLVFVEDLRVDLASSTVVVDAYILPLTRAVMSKIFDDLNALSPGTVSVVTHRDEMIAWKRLLPAFTERCRKWNHRPDCEYTQTGKIPLSTEATEVPICSCGVGKDVGTFAMRHKWKSVAPYVTRAAISPLFAVAFLEELGTPLGGEMNTGDEPQCAACGGPGKPKLLRCARCKKVSYCSAACQKAAWKRHKVNCKA
ncbi:hypothetical protein PLEOSDRAFT_1040377 [Pleurotus ostreatus PC15]|uniref:MYND-type domain-containing protein n=1 Tax=Pleurotus ostreatus (strain PC15) TaxID=1137138 RepID=A0A067NNU3_PLEO1|nr:hypothetical protein PLEOSDRAFT_1040377 [Pleurotus ostreatus PC15]